MICVHMTFIAEISYESEKTVFFVCFSILKEVDVLYYEFKNICR